MWQSHKIELKDMCGSPHIEIGGDIHPEERKYSPESLRHLQ